jgi:prepilin-type N-terminal cleavage/methylation domain-containing protein
MNKLWKNQKGFSLVELMVAILISGIFMYGLFTVLRASSEQTQSSTVKMNIQDSAREGLYKMLQEIRLSTSSQISILNGGTSIQFKVPDPNAPILADYRVDWDNGKTITYTLGGVNNRQIIRTDLSTAQSRVIANDVASVLFIGNAVPPRVVTVNMNVQGQMTNQRQMTLTPLQFSGKAELRNP